MTKSFMGMLYFLLIFTLLSLFACDNESQRSDGNTASETLNFVESSTGLPAAGQWRQGISFYDINEDGYLDILAPSPRKAAREEQRPHIWLGNGKGEWLASPPNVPENVPFDYGDIAAADFNGDGIPDMALAIHSGGLKGLKGEAEGKYGVLSEGLPAVKDFSTRALVSADFNNDGIADIAAAAEGISRKTNISAKRGAMVCFGTLAGWQCRRLGGEKKADGIFADQIITGDVNGDGNADIGIGSLQHRQDLIVWIGDGKGGFTPFNQGLPTGRHYRSVAFADLNGDGRDDLVATITGFRKDGTRDLRAFLSEEGGFKDISRGLPDNEVYLSVAAGDLDGDGRPEIVGGTAEGGLKVFSQKNAQWGRAPVSGLPEAGLQRIYGTYCVDLNRDGFEDIVVNYASKKLNNGGIRAFLTVPRQNK